MEEDKLVAGVRGQRALGAQLNIWVELCLQLGEPAGREGL